MLAGIGLVALSMVVMLRVTAEADPLAREDLAFALSVLLLALLMMVNGAMPWVRWWASCRWRTAWSLPPGAKGMPLVVEISGRLSILIAFIVMESSSSASASGSTPSIGSARLLQGRAKMSIKPLLFVLAIPPSRPPACLLPGYRASSQVERAREFTHCWRRALCSPDPEPDSISWSTI